MVRKTISLALTMVLGLGLSGCYFFPEEEPILEPPVVKVEEVNYTTYIAREKYIARQSIVTGYLVSKTQEDCFFKRADLPLKAIYVRPGELVEKGQLLVELEAGDIEFQLKLQKLNVEKAKAEYQVNSSESNRIQLQIEEETLAELQDKYDNSRIFATVSGQVSFVERLNVGDKVNAHSILVRIIDPDYLYVEYTSNYLKDFPLNQDVTIVVDEEEYEGYISKTPTQAIEDFDEKIDAVYADFKGEKPSYLKVGKLADIKAIYEVKENAIVIPKHLVKTLDGQKYVQIIQDEEKVDVNVTVGIENATEIEIVTGLKTGDKVVVK